MDLSFAVMLSFVLSLGMGLYVIPMIKKRQLHQSIQEDGPKSHHQKAGTPTMGGIIFLLPTIVLSFFFLPLNSEWWFLLLFTLGYGVIGLLDDGVKVFKKRNLGLTSKQKFLCQVVLALVGYMLLYWSGFDTSVYLPGTQYHVDIGWFFVLWIALLATATTNAVNLTDGLDGLVTGISILVLAGFAFVSYTYGQENLLFFSCILLSSLVAFLLFNAHPAAIFMGDTGSLALGGAIVAIAILLKMELLLLLLGGVFVVETLSVIIQVASFKLTKKRVFKMSPLHHHFELSGWSEQKVVYVFWGVQCILTVITITLFR